MHVYWIRESAQPDLSSDLIQSIARCLPRSSLTDIALVNKQWHLAVMPLLYRHVYICTPHHWKCFLRTIATTPAVQWAIHIRSIVLQKSPHLEPARLFGPIMSTTSHRSLGSGYIRSERVKLDLTGLETAEENSSEIDTTAKESEWLHSVQDDTMALAVQLCPNLQFLNVSGCEKLGDRTVHALVATSRQPLLGLWLGLLRSLSPQSMAALLESEQCKPDHPQLRFLDLSFCRNLGDISIRASMACWGSSLTHLRLNSLYELTDAAVDAIAEHCPHLRLLHLVRCWQLTNEPMNRLALACPHLVYVSVAFLSRAHEEGIRSFVHHCEHLQWLDITGTGINPLFKALILQSWEKDRIAKGWGPVHFQDDQVFLL